MNKCTRWMKFNLVGAMGMVLQLATLAFLSRSMPGRYLFATAASVEITLLHNFIWHLQYTWRDRRDGGSRLQQLVRFHISNGLVSIVGNFAVVWFFVSVSRLPIIVSNFIAILCCSIANFALGNNWAFTEPRGEATANKAP